MNDLLITEKITPALVFCEKGTDPILAEITKRCSEFKPDASTPKGRAEIKAFAFKVTRSKTFMDDERKKFLADMNKTRDAANAEGRKLWNSLEALQKKVRQPLTDFENAEKDRIAKHESDIQAIIDVGTAALNGWDTLSLDVMCTQLCEIEDEVMGDERWQEFAGKAAEAKDGAIAALNSAIDKRQTRDEEQAEIARLKKAEEDREQKDREDKIAADAAKKVKDEADAEATRKAEEAKQARLDEQIKADKEKGAIIREKEEAEELVAQAERAKIDAVEQAKKDEELAVLRERERVENERKAEEKDAADREADTKHRGAINSAAVAALQESGLNEDAGKAAITAIAKGNVPNVTIRY